LRFAKKFYLACLIAFLYAPIVILAVFSFNSAKSTGVFMGFSLNWYIKLFQNKTIMNALRNTLLIAVCSAFISTVIGTAAALGLHFMKKTPRRIALTINQIPVLNPDIVAGFSLMLMFLFVFKHAGIGTMGFGTLLVAHITFNLPFVVINVLPKIRQFDRSLYEAAQDLGATPAYAFWHITVPQLLPGIFAGAIFAFTLSLDDFVVSFFTKGVGDPNLSVYVYSQTAKRGISPEINALSTIMFAVIITLLFIVTKQNNKKKKPITKGDAT
jgi:spermidine/putrescine transport system permease protein